MRKTPIFILILFICVFVSSCSEDINEVPTTSESTGLYETTSVDKLTDCDLIISITRATDDLKNETTDLSLSTEQTTLSENSDVITEDSTESKEAVSETIKDITEEYSKNVRDIYAEFLEENSSRYLENNGEKPKYDPLYFYFDLDDDGADELVFFAEYENANCACVYFFDIIDGEVTEITSSEYVAGYRTADKFAVYLGDDGKHYIRKTNNDGNYLHMTTIYSYDGSELVPVKSVYGCYNDPSFFYVSDSGGDAFSIDTDKFKTVTEEEFSEFENQLYEFGTEVFNSSECFAE